MSRFKIPFAILAFFAFLVAPELAQAAPPKISVGAVTTAAGSSVSVPIQFTSGDSPVAATQFDITLGNSALSITSVTTGAASTAAGKIASSTELSGTNGVRVIVAGVNANTLGSGVLAILRVQVNRNASGSYPITVSNVISASTTADPVIVSADNGSVTTTSGSATVTYTVSGSVTMSGIPIPGVTVRVGSGRATTAINGSYTIPGIKAGKYNVSATKRGFDFTSSIGTSVTLDKNLTGANFTASCSNASQILVNGVCDFKRYSISGNITLNGLPVSNVQIKTRGKKATTDLNGNFMITGLLPGRYIISAYRYGYSFESILGGNVITLGSSSFSDWNYKAGCNNRFSVIGGVCTYTKGANALKAILAKNTIATRSANLNKKTKVTLNFGPNLILAYIVRFENGDSRIQRFFLRYTEASTGRVYFSQNIAVASKNFGYIAVPPPETGTKTIMKITPNGSRYGRVIYRVK